MTTLLGIDLGTSSVKAALIHSDTLQVIASAGQEYPVRHPQPGYAEQNPDDWWRAAQTTVRAVLAGIDPKNIVAIGLSGQMHGLVALGDDLTPLHPAIIWADARSAPPGRNTAKGATDYNGHHARMSGSRVHGGDGVMVIAASAGIVAADAGLFVAKGHSTPQTHWHNWHRF
jgi:xylulokinase